MLTREENELLTRVGPGTPMGRLMRRYWHAAALAREVIEPDGPPIRVRLLGEDLILFRDSQGDTGLVDAYCPHRRAPMFFGRNEECGLRCVYHGWKFDRNGHCIDMPSEPPESLFKMKVSITAYPTHEAGGIIWAYLGPRELMPAPPDYEYLRAPETHRFASKTFEGANWLQALEGGIDTAHSSFLHNMSIGEKITLRNADTAPRLEVERMDYGYRYAGIRTVRPTEDYVRVYHYVMPAQQFRGSVTRWEGGIKETPTLAGHVWVPIDDENTWVYNWMYSYDLNIPLSEGYILTAERNSGRAPEDHIPGTFFLKHNRSNDYGIDRAVQKTQTFTGIRGFGTQDIALQEGMGPIVDRSREHLGTTDRAIIAARQLLLEAIQMNEDGHEPRGVNPSSYRNVRAVDLLIPRDVAWRDYLKGELLARF